MDYNQLAERLGTVVKFMDGKMAGKPLPPSAKPELVAKAAEDRELAGLVLAGVELVGELLLDVKRIADASVPPALDLASAVERVARLLAKKEGERKEGNVGYVGDPGNRDERLQRWVDVNWAAFQEEAAELLAAAVPGCGT